MLTIDIDLSPGTAAFEHGVATAARDGGDTAVIGAGTRANI